MSGQEFTKEQLVALLIDEDNFASDTDAQAPTQQSVKAYVDGLVSGGLTNKGGYNAGTNTPDLDTSPSGILNGDLYPVTTAGTFFTEEVAIGDVLIANQDNPTTLSHWVRVEKNLNVATTTILGTLKLSTTATVDTGTATDEAVTPDTLNGSAPTLTGTNFTGIPNGALSTDPLARANHTGTQTASTISDFDTEVSNETNVAANTTHRSSDGKDHSDVVLNNTHRSSDGKDHSDVVLNNTHRSSDGKDHSDVVLNNTHRSSNGSDHTYINQDVTSGSTPTFTGTNFTGIPNGGLSTNPLARANHTGTQAASTITALPVEIGVAVSSETANLTTGTEKVTIRMPFAMTLTEVRANVNTAPTGSTIIVDINETGATILSTKLTIDATEKTSETAATAAVISDSALADDAEITVDIDQVGSTIAGKGLKVWLIGTRT